MKKPTRWTPVLFFLPALLFLLYPSAEPVSAQTECVAVTMDDQPRNCTATEEMGMCLTEALDSRDACVESKGWFGRRGCDALFVWDGAFCIASALVPI